MLAIERLPEEFKIFSGSLLNFSILLSPLLSPE